jgi:hypothetical protein
MAYTKASAKKNRETRAKNAELREKGLLGPSDYMKAKTKLTPLDDSLLKEVAEFSLDGIPALAPPRVKSKPQVILHDPSIYPIIARLIVAAAHQLSQGQK